MKTMDWFGDLLKLGVGSFLGKRNKRPSQNLFRFLRLQCVSNENLLPCMADSADTVCRIFTVRCCPDFRLQ